MRILILGSSGPIGRAIAKSARSAGAEIVGVSRSPAAGDGPEHIHLVADRSNPRSIRDLIRDRQIDIVIDVVAYTPETTHALLSELDGAVGRYLLVSSCDVFRNYGLLQRKEAGTAILGEMDEAAPLRASRYPYRGDSPRDLASPDRWMDDYDKIPIERAVVGLRSDWTILRLPMVYGPGDRQRRFKSIVAPMLMAAENLDLPSALLRWVTTYGYVDNVGAAISHAALHSGASRRIFNVGGEGPAVSHYDWIDRFRVATGWVGVLREDTDPHNPVSQAIAGLDLTTPLRISGRRLEETLGFHPPVDLATAVRQTAQDESANLSTMSAS